MHLISFSCLIYWLEHEEHLEEQWWSWAPLPCSWPLVEKFLSQVSVIICFMLFVDVLYQLVDLSPYPYFSVFFLIMNSCWFFVKCFLCLSCYYVFQFSLLIQWITLINIPILSWLCIPEIIPLGHYSYFLFIAELNLLIFKTFYIQSHERYGLYFSLYALSLSGFDKWYGLHRISRKMFQFLEEIVQNWS